MVPGAPVVSWLCPSPALSPLPSCPHVLQLFTRKRCPQYAPQMPPRLYWCPCAPSLPGPCPSPLAPHVPTPPATSACPAGAATGGGAVGAVPRAEPATGAQHCLPRPRPHHPVRGQILQPLHWYGDGEDWGEGGPGSPCLPGGDALGVLTLLPAEWSQRDLARAENIKFCRQYLIFHDGASIVYSGPAGTCSEIKDE